MTRRSIKYPTVVTAASLAFLISSVAAQAHAQSSGSPLRSDMMPDRRIALTFDDLPATGPTLCDVERIREITRKLTGVLEKRGIPAMGLATPGRRCATASLLEETLGRWQRTDAIIGNHSATHPDLNSTSLEAYLTDIGRGQALIDSAVTTSERWFRPPLLHSGNVTAKKQGLDAYLSANGYRLAPVTMDNQEFVYAAVYASARARGEERLAKRVADAYLLHLAEATDFYERLSIDAFGREIPQVMLLHANLLNAEHLARVIDMLGRRGYTFIGVPEALADSAYSRRDAYVGPRGLSWLQRWALAAGIDVPAEPREADWVARAFRESR